jgi:hypothetical protein
MAYPIWLTPAGNLGIVPEQAYYDFHLDAYDTAGGALKFTKVSGTLPPGVQVVNVGNKGYLRGIPISTAGADNNQTYTFTIRLQNQTDKLIADRTFSLTITNIAPPVIVPRNVDLGTYYDGAIIDLQLEAAEFIFGGALTWTVKDGELPSGLTLSTSGLISGYLKPIPVAGPGNDNDWDMAEWDEKYTINGQSGQLAWDFIQGTTSKAYKFTVQVYDGVNFDVSTYKMLVVPRASYGADSTRITADATIVSGNRLTADFGDRHTPIITTTQTDIVPERQGGWFAYQIQAIDLDEDVLQYTIPTLSQGSFDEQVLVGNSVPYVDAQVTNGNIAVGVMSLSSPNLPGLLPGTEIQVLSDYTDPATEQTFPNWYDATVNSHTTVRLTGNAIISASVGKFITQAISNANATIINTSPTTGTITLYGNANIAYANVGDTIRQFGSTGNATIISAHGSFNANTQNPYTLSVQYNSGIFTIGSGNVSVNGRYVSTYPTATTYNVDLKVIYNNSNVFRLNITDITAKIALNGANTYSYPTTITSVGVQLGSSTTQGAGFDGTDASGHAIRFDQGSLQLPSTLSMDINSGWITGLLPTQTANQTGYQFAVDVYKRDYQGYIASKLFSIDVLGDLYNNIQWLTPSNLGTIENGAVSDLFITAISTKGKEIYYYYTPGAYLNVPQGLKLQPDGLISGRVSFELFSLDNGYTTFDSDFTGNPATTFDHTFEFSVTAQTFDLTASDTRVFTILVRGRNITPYENLYLTARLSQYQKLEYRRITQDHSVFPPDSIYRTTDPWFGISQDIRTLFVPGLTPSSLGKYAQALSTNHFNKRLLFSDIKTAVARQDGVYDVTDNATGGIVGTFNIYTNTFVPTDYSLGYTVSSSIPSGTTVGDQHVKYEVVYAQVLEENSNAQGQGPADSINLTGVISNPYYDTNGNTFVIATPNSFTNMTDAISNGIGYANKGALPDWMTSVQPNGAQLGFVRAVVLAYTKPGASETIAWRFKQHQYDLNELNFTVNSYDLDNKYSANYDLTANAFIASRQTTFDRYSTLSSTFKHVGTVDYAVTTPFQEINERTVAEVNAAGGLDGYENFRDGETLVFYNQEFVVGQNIGDSYNQGWADTVEVWDGDLWDYDNNTVSTLDDIGWDQSNYIPGYNEWLSSRVVDGGRSYYTVPNERASIWKININADNYIKLTLANVTTNIKSVTANTRGYGSNVEVTSTDDIFIGMMAKGYGFANTAVVTDINGANITIYPSVSANITVANVTLLPTLGYNQTLYVRNGDAQGRVNVYYDPIIKTGRLIPNFSKISQQVATKHDPNKKLFTTFDGNGTLFFDHRDSYSIPEQGDATIKFPHVNVFD